MNAPRTLFTASRALRLFFASVFGAALLAGLLVSASLAGMRPAATPNLGATVALIAGLRSLHAQANVGTGPASLHGPNGRTMLDPRMMRPGALLKPAAATTAIVPIAGAVQTYDVFNPPPAFRPLVGFGSLTALNNDSTNPPVYIGSLAPVNLTPVWSRDETFLIFSSNRTATGGVQIDGRFHLWAISVNGGEAFQITSSLSTTAAPLPAGGGEFFPALSGSNNALAFTSDAQSPGVQNLYALQSNSSFSPVGPFTYNGLVGLNNARAFVDVTSPQAIVPLTIRAADPTVAVGDYTTSPQFTGFDQVQRPTFSPSEQLIVFGARSVTGTNKGHAHLYFLNTNTRGFDANSASYPGKLTDGPADDTDPAYSPDGQFVAFASTASTIATQTNTNPANGGTNSFNPSNPDNSQAVTAAPAAVHSIFLLSGGSSVSGAGFGTVISTSGLPGGRVTLAGSDNYGPAWSNFANQNQYTNPQGNFAYLAFSRGVSIGAPHDVYYFQVAQNISSPNTETLTAESAGNPVVKLNTDDNAGETSVAGDVYEKAYPAWSPFLSIFSITYSSNRTVTYNRPILGIPTETARSISQGGTANNPDGSVSYTVGSGYVGIQVSQVLNLDPPALLRFNADEVVHVQAPGANPVTGTANKLAGAGANRTVTLTVRLSDREAGIDDTGGPNGGPRVYVQIKNPSSKYQDSQNTEHKVFAKDRRYDAATQTNHPSSDVTSQTINSLLDLYSPNPQPPVSTVAAPISAYGFSNNADFNGFLNPFNYNPAGAYTVNDHLPFPNKKYGYPGYGPLVGIIQVGYVYPRGAHGGQWPFDATLNPDNTYIFVGKDGGGTNPGLPTPTPETGGDPRLFIPTGPEYECEVLNPQFATSGNANAPGDATPLASRFASTVSNPGATVGDYVTPYWLAGVDDQGAFSGGTYTSNTGASALQSFFGSVRPDGVTQSDRPNANYTTGAGGTRHPAEWLQLQRVPAALQDNAGGVLYTVNFTAPAASGSDFYVDVIAYDKAVFPNIPNTGYQGTKTNWRIYDNVGGFSTNQSIGNNDILVVSDYALGQKFAATTFGGRNTNLNLVPKLFGTESYLTDIDVSYLPDSVYGGISLSNKPAPTYQYNAVVSGFSGIATQNGLGVGSYLDNVIDDFTQTGGAANVKSQRYSIWRILSRGPVPQRVLNSYLPNAVLQPAVVDAGDPTGAYKNVPAATVLDAQRCVIWLSPYTGDVLEDPGALDDPGTVNGTGRNSTTKNLTAFVQAGGRLCITGQDVGSTLTQGGALGNTPSANPAAPNFLPDVLNATLASTGTAVRALTGTQNRITGNSQFDGVYDGRGSAFVTLGGAFAPGGGFNNFFYVFPNYPYQDNLVIGDADYGDSALSQIPPLTLPTGASLQGQPDTIVAINGATSAATYGAGGPTALVYHDDPYGLPAKGATAGQLPNGGTGSRVVYAAFGLDALSQDYYSPVPPSMDTNDMNGPAYDQRNAPVIPRNPRSGILHNIVNFLRTGLVTGTITQTSGTGQGGGLGIDGATVYLRSASGAAPSTRATFSASTANGGRFTIFGVEPGTYFLVAVKPGFQRASSNSNTPFTVEGDVTVSGKTLTLTPLPNGSVAGLVKDTAGNPITGATVVLTSQDNSVTQRIVTPTNIPASINPTDNYFFQSVPVASYTALATGPLNPNGKQEYQAPAGGATSVAPDAPNDKGFGVASSPTVDGVNFTLTPVLASISGRIYDKTSTDDATGGALTAGAIVTLTDASGKAVGAPVAAAADGTYSFTNVPATNAGASFTVTAVKAGYTTGTLTIKSVFLGDALTGQDIGLAPILAGVVTGTVTDSASGAPVAGAVVTLVSTDKTVTLKSPATGADGVYTLAKVPPGTYTGTAIGPLNPNGRPRSVSGAVQTITVASAPPNTTANFTVTIIPPSFAGTVTDSATKKPLQNAVITVTDSGTTSTKGTVVKTVQTAADGTYSTGTLPEGTYTLTASLAGYASLSLASQTIYQGDALTGQDFALVAAAPGSISGQVIDQQTTAGVPGAVVSFKSTDGTVTLPLVTTNASGTFVIPPPPGAANVPAGSYVGSAVGPNNPSGKPEYTPSAVQTIVVPAGGTASGIIFLVSEIAPSLSGVVSDHQTGAPIAGATVTLTDSNTGKAQPAVTTGADGTYSFTNIPAIPSGPTPYTLAATAPSGYFPATSQTVPISLGDKLTGDNLLLDEQGTITGLVTDSSTGQPLANVTLTVTDTTTGGTVTTVPSPLATVPGTATGPDGKPENYLATFILAPGHDYAVAAVKANYNTPAAVPVTPAPLTNTVPGRADIQLTSSIGTLGGLVTDASTSATVGGAAVTVTNATTGAVVATFTTNGSATAGPDGKPLNYTGQVAQGTYTVTLTQGSRTPVVQKAVVVKGGQFNRLDFTGTNGTPPIFTFPAGLQFVSTPYDYSALGFDALFGTLNTAPTGTTPNGNRSRVAVWDPTISQYALDPNAPADSLKLGVGYWVFLKTAVNVTQQGATPTAPFVPVALHPFWNQIGVPRTTPVNVADLQFDNGAGGKITYASAASSQYAIIPSGTAIYSFDGASYQPVSQSGTLQPWKAYWIKVNVNATLEIPTK